MPGSFTRRGLSGSEFSHTVGPILASQQTTTDSPCPGNLRVINLSQGNTPVMIIDRFIALFYKDYIFLNYYYINDNFLCKKKRERNIILLFVLYTSIMRSSQKKKAHSLQKFSFRPSTPVMFCNRMCYV